MIIRKTYKQGDSVAITIPKAFKVKKDTHYTVEKRGDNIILKPVAVT
jgi:virulence-associated protein VagC